MRGLRSSILNLKDIESKYDDLKKENRMLKEKLEDLEGEAEGWKAKSRLLIDLEGQI